MNKKLMDKLGITEDDLQQKPDIETIKSEQENMGSTLDYILTEIIPLLMVGGLDE